jgi:hypothetical protein
MAEKKRNGALVPRRVRPIARRWFVRPAYITWATPDTRTIQGYLGHKSIQHTVRYTELAPGRFKSLFHD